MKLVSLISPSFFSPRSSVGVTGSRIASRILCRARLKHVVSLFVVLVLPLLQPARGQVAVTSNRGETLVLSKEALQDKIKGGWAGQTIGVTFGGPMEFKFNGTMIQAYQSIPWRDGYIKETMTNTPGLYDDIYMDLTFVSVFEKEGLDAPASSFARAFANADYPLWHANQSARYNVLHNISPSKSGHWLNNPHADCIDYQIESDFAGLMCPGMPQAASEISDKIGHMMNYGDGWYGGVYLGALYTLAFTSDDIPAVVEKGLAVIPANSKYYKCIRDVIDWHKKYPQDWKQAWFEVQRKWSSDIGCPDGVYRPFNIDATVNSAYVVIALLYGDGDFGKTLEIATRCGQDADCNPSSAGGILGTILGYNKIPDYWKRGLKEAEQMKFKFTDMSLQDVYTVGYGHALQMIERNGGKIGTKDVTIRLQTPEPVRFEQSFAGLFPSSRITVDKKLEQEYNFDFNGTGFVLSGETAAWQSNSTYVFLLEVWVDGKMMEKAELPTAYHSRRNELCWQYELPKGLHHVVLKLRNPNPKYTCRIGDILTYTDTPPELLSGR